MCILTRREIEFLTGLQRRWWKLYWHELARLLAENAVREAETAFWRKSHG
jgi:hypothetical protein